MVSLFAFTHFCSLFNSNSACLSSKLKSLPDKKQFVSSAKSFIIILWSDLYMSLINKRNNIGPNTDPWGTPYSQRYMLLEWVSLISTNCFLFSKYDLNHSKASPRIP